MMGRYGLRIPILCLVAALAGIGIRSRGAEQQDAQALIAQARTLLDAGNVVALEELAVHPEALSWLDSQKRRAKWKLSLLPMPGKAPGQPLAVFHDFHTCESISDHIHRLVKTPAGWRFGSEIQETDTRGFRIRDHQLTVRYDLPNNGCAITDLVTIERLGTERIGLLRLSADMRVESVTRGGKPFPVTHTPGVIALLAPPERKFVLQIRYRGKVNHPNSDYILPSETVLVSYWYPHIGRLPAKHGVTVTVPKGWTAIGQGELMGKMERASETTFRYRNEIPTCYFSLDAGPYQITTRKVDGRKFSLCELKSVPSRSAKAFDDLTQSLAFFEKSFGKFPYSHYEIVETLQPFGGALEAYSFATFQSGTIPGAIVHEVAHTWWGGVVPNPYTRTMWNESFASYSDGLFRRQSTPGRRALQGMHQDAQKGRGMLQGFRVPISKATDTSDSSHASVGYGKGSLVLAMLEDLLGQEMMIRCMRRFYQDHKRGEAADWTDFARAVKRETGTDYGWFFEQWLYRGGAPEVRLADVAPLPGGGVKVRIIQEGAPYRLRIPIVLETVDGPVTQELSVEGASTEFTISTSSPVKSVKLDPAGNILMAGAKGPDDKADPFSVTL